MSHKLKINQLITFTMWMLIFAIAFLGGRSVHILQAKNEGLIPKRTEKVLKQNNVVIKKEEPKSFTVLLAGDVMLGRSVATRSAQFVDAKELSSDYIPKAPFRYIKEYTSSADLFFFNLEGPLSDKGKNGGKSISFRFDPVMLAGIFDSGVDVISIANNHSLDWGTESLCDTYTRLQAAQFKTIGAGCNYQEAVKPAITTLPDGTTIGWLAFTQFDTYGKAGANKPGLAPYSKEWILSAIKDLKTEKVDPVSGQVIKPVDLVFVSVHWGDEYKTVSNKTQQDWARFMIDSGANVIIGHHPHVLQEKEEYNGGTIFYSLGNFVFDQYFSENTMSSSLGKLVIKNKKVESSELVPIKLTQYYQPYLVSNPPTDITLKPAKPVGQRVD